MDEGSWCLINYRHEIQAKCPNAANNSLTQGADKHINEDGFCGMLKLAAHIPSPGGEHRQRRQGPWVRLRGVVKPGPLIETGLLYDRSFWSYKRIYFCGRISGVSQRYNAAIRTLENYKGILLGTTFDVLPKYKVYCKISRVS
jgi:hypothetical protein